MRNVLDRLYYSCGVIAALSMIGILVVILIQIFSRWMLIPFPGSSEYAGYLMATSSFMAFPYALNASSHIRVTLFTKMMGRFRYYGECWCFLIASLISCYLAWFAWKMIYWSLKLGDISQGQDEMPLWIVQIPVALGASMLAICFIDNLVTLLMSGKDNIQAQKSLDMET